MRRAHNGVQGAASAESAMVALDKNKCQARVKGVLLDLTVVEFNLFSVLVNDPGRVFQREQLMQSIYKGYRIVSDRTIDSHIKKLRKKRQPLK